MTNQIVATNKNAGLIAGIVACVLAVLGILTIGFLFVPLAAIVAIVGTIGAIKNKAAAGIGANALAWILIIVGVITSPVLVGIITFGAAGAAA